MQQTFGPSWNKRRAAVEKAKITRERNNLLRTSTTGRLLLELERCVVTSTHRLDSRRFARFLKDLRYACQLADEAGVKNGWFKDYSGLSSVAFELSSGDVVFSKLDESLGNQSFWRKPIASDNSRVLAKAIEELLAQIIPRSSEGQTNPITSTTMGNSSKDASSRRSTRIATDVLVEVKGEDFAYAGETITVNLHGALVRIAAPLKVGDPLVVHVHRTGMAAPARIVFIDDEPSQFGIELETPCNIWGISIPPSDWFPSEPKAS